MSALRGGGRFVDHATGQFLGFVVRYRGRFAAGLAGVALTNLITLTGPWVLKYAVDDLALGVTRDKLLVYAALILGIAATAGTARFVMRRTIVGVSRAIEYDIRQAYFAHLQRLPVAFFHGTRTGDLMSRATSDLSAVRMMVGPAVMYATSTGITFVIAIAMMASINARLTLLALLPLPLVTATSRFFGRAIHERFELIQAQLADLSAVTQEALAGVRVLRAYRQERADLERFRRANEEYVERNRRLIALQGLFYPSMGLFMGLAECLVLWLGARDVITGRMTVGELVAFNGYLSMLAWPMIAFGWVTNLVQRGRASWGRMLHVLETPPGIDDAAVTHRHLGPQDVAGAIALRHLSFAFGDRRVLDDITVEIPAGRTVAVVGPTGSGKSILMSLLARLHDPPPGTVFVDGIDVRHVPLATLRAAIGFVPQEPFLFSDTLAENVAFGDGASGGADTAAGGRIALPGTRAELAPAAAPMLDRVMAAAGVAQLDKDVADFPAGYATRIGERGITLSGGQKQRTAIARALFVDPRILILDDALSAVDTHTEEEILHGLRAFRQGRTTFIVSHRISTVRDADIILVLDEGRIVERGDHDALVAMGGAYAELYRLQLLEEELAAS